VPPEAATSKIPAAERTFALLQLLARASAGMTASAIATRLKIPRSSTYQLLEIAQRQGFVVQFPEEHRWGLGVAAFELGSAYLRHDPLERLAQPLLNRLLHQLADLEVVGQVGILSGAELLYLLKSYSQAHLQAARPVITEVGIRLPAHLTASGRSMLALLSSAQLRATYPGGAATVLPRRTDHGPDTNRALTDLLAAERTAGFSVEHNSVTVGYSSVAAASVNHLGLPVAAFGVTFRSEQMPTNAVADLERLIADRIRPVAAELSRRLGAK
jgi:DNA-binding IclR family transcriptional regulator